MKKGWRQATQEENEVIRGLLIEDIKFQPKSIEEYVRFVIVVHVIACGICFFTFFHTLKSAFNDIVLFICWVIVAIITVYVTVNTIKYIIDTLTDKKNIENYCKKVLETEFHVKDVKITKISSCPDGFESQKIHYSAKIIDLSKKETKKSYPLLCDEKCDFGTAFLVDTRLDLVNKKYVVCPTKDTSPSTWKKYSINYQH